MKVVIAESSTGFVLSQAAGEQLIAAGVQGLKRHNFGPVVYIFEGVSVMDDPQPRALEHFRSDPRLITIVEELGEAVSVGRSRLKIIDIPFDSVEGWHIALSNNYMESVVEDHREWY